MTEDCAVAKQQRLDDVYFEKRECDKNWLGSDVDWFL